MFLAALTGYEEFYPLGVFEEERDARRAAITAWWRRRRYWRLSQDLLDAEMGETSPRYSDHIRPKVIALPLNEVIEPWWERDLRTGSVGPIGEQA